MRTFVTTILVCLILACPFVCGAAEAGHGSHRDHTTGEAQESPSPVHCPEGGDDCVCRGAVQPSNVKVPLSDAISVPGFPQAATAFLAHSLARSLTHLTSDGHPAGLSSWGDSRAIRAFLQDFRC